MAYLMVPSSGELTELAVHVLEHGDSAHSESAGHERPDGDDEHGCSGTFHLCLCHHTSGFIAHVPIPALFEAPSIERPVTTWRHDAPHSVAHSDIFRPPIA
jgi:hypothetical protein